MAASADSLLERLAAEPKQAAILLDFDGVLAPIVAVPDAAAVPEETRAELRRLAGRYGLVGVVSGRAGDDVRARVAVDELAYVGSHGLELDPQADRWRATVAAVATAAPWPPGWIERKGLSLSLHYREAPDERAAVLELEAIAATARTAGLVARFGRKVLEVLPPLDSNKGTAVRHLLAEAGLERALVAGDDTTDLDAFRAVDGLELAIRVAVVSPESPSLLAESADIVVESPAAFLDVLRRL